MASGNMEVFVIDLGLLHFSFSLFLSFPLTCALILPDDLEVDGQGPYMPDILLIDVSALSNHVDVASTCIFLAPEDDRSIPVHDHDGGFLEELSLAFAVLLEEGVHLPHLIGLSNTSEDVVDSELSDLVLKDIADLADRMVKLGENHQEGLLAGFPTVFLEGGLHTVVRQGLDSPLELSNNGSQGLTVKMVMNAPVLDQLGRAEVERDATRP